MSQSIKPSTDLKRWFRRRIVMSWTLPWVPGFLTVYLNEDALMSIAVIAGVVIWYIIRVKGQAALPALSSREEVVIVVLWIVQLALLFMDLPTVRLVVIGIIISLFVPRMLYLDLKVLLFPSQYINEMQRSNPPHTID